MNDDISGTGQFAGLSSADPVPAYKPPEISTRPAAAAATPSRSNGSIPSVAAALDAAQAATADSQLGQAQRSAPDSSRSSGGRAGSGKAPSSEEIAAAVSAANVNLASSNRSLEYRVDAATGISIAMIRNTQTGAVVQQIPGADIIALARMLAEWSPGKHMLLDLIA